ncbi:MAG: glycerate kinase [Clostridia bacterium]|nr:glycerate kinase [Clostridia bacterium]
MNKNTKILIAPDSFKGSISAADAAAAIARGIARGMGQNAPTETLCVPIADGGEGTLDALVPESNRFTLTVTGTDGPPVTAEYGHIGDTAVIEMARAAGLTLVPEARRSALTSTTFGVGELMLDALGRGYRKFLLTVGGSGTNDGGCGMFAALGARFYDQNGNTFVPTGGTLMNIAKIDTVLVDNRLFDCQFTIATDVKNPLLGENGATYVYARQKGANDMELAQMERGMSLYAALWESTCGKAVSSIPGCGAGGGFSTPLLGMLNAEIRSGIDAVLDAVDFEAKLEDVTAVITGEGKIDRQSLFGKAISGVCRAAAKRNIPVYAFVGCIGDDKQTLLDMGLKDIVAIGDLAPDAAYSMTHAYELLERAATDLAL